MSIHFVVKCRSKTKWQALHAVFEDKVSNIFDLYSSAEEYIFVVNNERQENFHYDKKLFATMIINGKQVQFQFDTGATVNVLPPKNTKISAMTKL